MSKDKNLIGQEMSLRLKFKTCKKNYFLIHLSDPRKV